MRIDRVDEKSDSLIGVLFDNYEIPFATSNRYIVISGENSSFESTNAPISRSFELFEVTAMQFHLQYEANNPAVISDNIFAMSRIMFKDNIEGARYLNMTARINSPSILDLSNSPILLRNTDDILFDFETRMCVPPQGVVYNSSVDEIQTIYPPDFSFLVDMFVYLHGRWIDIGGL